MMVVVVQLDIMVMVEVVIAMHGVPLVSGTKRRAGFTWLAWQRWD